MSKDKTRWLTFAEVRKFFEVSNHMINVWIGDCGMPVHQVGDLSLFKKQEVDEWIKAGGADRLNHTAIENQ
jgi:excisionase family DNA binding protein